MRVEIQLKYQFFFLFYFAVVCLFFQLRVFTWSQSGHIGVPQTKQTKQWPFWWHSCISEATMENVRVCRLPCWCFKPILWKLNSFPMWHFPTKDVSDRVIGQKKNKGEGKETSPLPLFLHPPPPLFHSCATFSTISLGNSCYAGDFSLFQYMTTATVSISSYNEL